MNFFCLVASFLMSMTFLSASQAIVFDFGGVMTGEPKKEVVVEFLKSTFALSDEEFQKVNLEKREAVKKGQSDEEFWLNYAVTKNISLPSDWPLTFKKVMKMAIGINEEMYVLVAELKAKQIPIALLSNIDVRLSKLIREFGLYEPFDPCLLSCEIGIEKPDQKAYEMLLSKMQIPAEDIIFIDDRQENVIAAQNIGLDAILFQSLLQLRQELQKRELGN